MIIQTLVFYLFSFILILSAFMVIFAANPVHSVLWLILAFFNASGFFVLMGAEYIAMVLMIVYVGAVAVLFLFVVMMLDIDTTQMRKKFLQYMPVGVLIGLVLLVEIIFVVGGYEQITPPSSGALIDSKVTNAHAIGLVLYTEYIYPFQIAGLVLLVAMIGSIVLTLRHKPGVRRQKIVQQHMRKVEDSIEIKKVKSGSGA